MVTMKISSYNVRGLGGFEKRKEVCRFVHEKNPFVLCIQESKLGKVDDSLRQYGVILHVVILTNRRYIGASGGLLSVWDRAEVEVWLSMSFCHVLVIKGCFIQSGQDEDERNNE